MIQCREMPFRAGRRTAALSARTGFCRGVPGDIIFGTYRPRTDRADVVFGLDVYR
jgi:hypothetical protein